MNETCVDVAVFSPLRHHYTYLWPQSLGPPEPGVRVLVPFGRGRRLGLVRGERRVPARGEHELKVVLDRLDAAPLFDEARRRWLERATRYYAAAPGEMAATALAWAANEENRRWRPTSLAALQDFDPLLAAAFASERTLAAGTLRRKTPVTDFFHRLQRAAAKGFVREVVAMDEDGIPSMPAEGVPERLRPAQVRALEAIAAAHGFTPFLLFGCTGAGKTEVYLRAVQAHIAAGGQAMILVPEIGLTPQWLARLGTRFERVAVWHSGLSLRRRLAVRSRLADVDVLIGTRSALFLPLPRLSILVVDEEHDASYKQQDGVHYHARDLAVLLAQEMRLPLVLGSATPSLESWRHARAGDYRLLSLPQRIAPHAPPEIEIVDMRSEDDVLSSRLLAALGETREQGLQSLLYLNRRGYAPALMCTACGDVPECPACSLRLTLHRRRRQLRCHACGYLRPVPRLCEACGEESLLPLGEGTEKVEDHLAARLPALRFARLDRDAVRSGRRLQALLGRFAAGELDCLIGTQMLVKGHHFPRVALVGVVNADLGLNLPDFRAGERWWQQITQVVGRTGRGNRPGRVLVQTRNPEAPWLLRIDESKAEATLDTELALRKAMEYPPFARWIRIVFASGHAAAARETAAAMVHACTRLASGVQCVGPMPCAVERLGGRHRYEIVLRDADRKDLPWRLVPLLEAMKIPAAVRMRVDVDPMDMM